MAVRGGGKERGTDGHQNHGRLPRVPVGWALGHAGVRRPSRAEDGGGRRAGVHTDGHEGGAVPAALPDAAGGRLAAVHGPGVRRGGAALRAGVAEQYVLGTAAGVRQVGLGAQGVSAAGGGCRKI